MWHYKSPKLFFTEMISSCRESFIACALELHPCSWPKAVHLLSISRVSTPPAITKGIPKCSASWVAAAEFLLRVSILLVSAPSPPPVRRLLLQALVGITIASKSERSPACPLASDHSNTETANDGATALIFSMENSWSASNSKYFYSPQLHRQNLHPVQTDRQTDRQTPPPKTCPQTHTHTHTNRRLFTSSSQLVFPNQHLLAAAPNFLSSLQELWSLTCLNVWVTTQICSKQ
jgi:hypothetical protein